MTDSLYHRINDTIREYIEERGITDDSEFIGTLAAILGDFMTPATTKDRTVMREFIDRCIDEKIVLNVEQGAQPLHS